MPNNPLVSVIIPFLNGGRFIQEAIDSVFNQTYNCWELLLVDDGSTDGSTALAQRYAAQNPERVRYLEHAGHQNRGLSASRNLGIMRAKGEYVAFLDADDVWLRHKLEEQVAILAAWPEAAMVYGASQYWYSWTGKPQDVQRDYVQEHGIPAEMLFEPPTLLTLFLRGRAAIPAPCSILLRREVASSIVEYEDSLYEDQALYAQVCLQAPVFVSKECWDRYRQHPDSLCAVAAQTRRAHAARLAYLRWLRAYLVKGGFEGSEVWHALQKELRYYENTSRLGLNKVTRYLTRRGRKLWLRIAERVLP